MPRGSKRAQSRCDLKSLGKKNATAGTLNETVTLYYGPVEIRNYGSRRYLEELVTYPHPDMRFVNDELSYLHRDQLQSVRLITDKDGARAKMKYYRPFGEIGSEWTPDPTHTVEEKGFIGERYVMGAGFGNCCRNFETHSGYN